MEERFSKYVQLRILLFGHRSEQLYLVYNVFILLNFFTEGLEPYIVFNLR